MSCCFSSLLLRYINQTQPYDFNTIPQFFSDKITPVAADDINAWGLPKKKEAKTPHLNGLFLNKKCSDSQHSFRYLVLMKTKLHGDAKNFFFFADRSLYQKRVIHFFMGSKLANPSQHIRCRWIKALSRQIQKFFCGKATTNVQKNWIFPINFALLILFFSVNPKELQLTKIFQKAMFLWIGMS